MTDTACPDTRAAREIAVRLLRQVEGCRLAPYQDVAGVWTIGIGCIRLDGAPVTHETPALTQDQAEAACLAELAEKADAVDAAVQVDLPDPARAALYSFAYNEGIHAFQTSSLLRLLNTGHRDAASAEFPKWVYAAGRVIPGLVTRRRLERALFDGTTTV